MGYTNYWGESKKSSRELVKDMKSIIEEAGSRGIVIRGWDGTGEPKITAARVAFNGDADTRKDYETFLLDGSRSFCKTAGKPYDIVVCAVLLRIAHYDPSFHVSSDGQWDDEWVPAREMYQDIFHEEAVKPEGMF